MSYLLAQPRIDNFFVLKLWLHENSVKCPLYYSVMSLAATAYNTTVSVQYISGVKEAAGKPRAKMYYALYSHYLSY